MEHQAIFVVTAVALMILYALRVLCMARARPEALPLMARTTSFAAAKAGDPCVICLAEIEEGERAVALECAHTYHAACIREWLERSIQCPICMRVITN